MPIQKNRSKDIPGKDGYSVRDIEKLTDVINDPGKYGVDPNDTGNGDDKDNCLEKLFQFFLLAVTFSTIIS